MKALQVLAKLIDKFYLDREREKREKRKERVRFYISEVGKCPRAIFFRFKQAPAEEIEPERLRVFEEGEIIQQRILRHLFSLGLVRATEIPIPSQEIISGRADAIVSFTDERTLKESQIEIPKEIEFGTPYVLEIKSISGRMNFEKMEPLEQHIKQLQLYLHFFKIKNGILLYLNKDTQEMKEFWVDYDEKMVASLLEWFEALKKKIEQNTIPKRLPDWPKNWECTKCQFAEICRLAGENEVSWEEFKKQIESLENVQQV